MKKSLFVAATVLLALIMLVGCSKTQAETPTADPSVSPAQPSTPTEAEGSAKHEDTSKNESAAFSDSIDAAYAQQIDRYYTAISSKWNEGTYFEHEMSALTAYYYEGNALENIGFTCMDLDGDNSRELIIGAIQNAEQQPLVFEIWTLQNGVPVMLAQSGSRNRYYTQYAKDDGIWTIANEAESSAATHAVYYLQLSEGKFEVTQGVLFDAAANEKAPWFMAYDLDWNVSNDTPIDKDTADAVMEAGRNIYTAMEYIPYSLYK